MLRHVGSWLPNPEIKPAPPELQGKVPATGPPEVPEVILNEYSFTRVSEWLYPVRSSELLCHGLREFSVLLWINLRLWWEVCDASSWALPPSIDPRKGINSGSQCTWTTVSSTNAHFSSPKQLRKIVKYGWF